MDLRYLILFAAAVGLVSVGAAASPGGSGHPGAVETGPELEDALSRSAELGDAHTVRITRITPDYLQVMYNADLEAGRTDKDIAAYGEAYRAGRSLAFRATVEGPRGQALSLLEFPGRAVLTDGLGHEYASDGWRERPVDDPAMREGVLFFPMYCRDGPNSEPSTRSFTVTLQSVGRPGEATFTWVVVPPGGNTDAR